MTAVAERQIIEFPAADHVPLRFVRLRGGPKGPVIAAPGIATSTDTFRIRTVEQNLADALTNDGYDVWLFDWRGSSALEAREFTLDQVARNDWPRAIAEVQERTGARNVQVVAHCLASITLLMSLGGGYLNALSLRSAVLTAVGAHIRVPRVTATKARLGVPRMLRRAGIRFADPRVAAFADRPSLMTRAMDSTLRLRFRSCQDDVCHRVSFIYGVLYEHANLNSETHDSLSKLFGAAGIQTFLHLQQLVRMGHIRAFDYGSDRNIQCYGNSSAFDYLAHLRRFDLPITFIHGERSHCFLPDSTRETFDVFRRANVGPYSRHVVPGYGHMDLLIGRHAFRDVYPLILESLDAHAGD